MKITEELRLGELQTTEFKKSLSLQKEAFQALCGMVNADPAHGTVYFGVAPDQSVVGVEPGDLDSAQKKLATALRQKFDPPIISLIETVEWGDKRLIRLKADRGTGVAIHEYDGRAYIREGTTTRVLSLAEKQQLVDKRLGNAQSILEGRIFGP